MKRLEKHPSNVFFIFSMSLGLFLTIIVYFKPMAQNPKILKKNLKIDIMHFTLQQHALLYR